MFSTKLKLNSRLIRNILLTVLPGILLTGGLMYANSNIYYDLDTQKTMIATTGGFNVSYTTSLATTTIIGDLAVNIDQLYVDKETGYVGIGTSTPAKFFSVAGSTYITGGLGIGVSTTTAGVIQTSGNVEVGGNLKVLGSATIIGGSISDTLTINSTISSDLIPDQNAVRDLGATSYYWNDIYVDQLIANNISAASTTIGGTKSESFTINSDNSTPDTENMDLVFFRGTVVPNALLKWDSISDKFDINQPVFIQNDSSTTTVISLDVWGRAGQTADLFRVASSSGDSYLNITNTGYVGIGTTSPSQMLTIGDDNQFTVSSAGVVDLTSITFNNVTDTIAGIQNQNLLDKTAAGTITGIWDFSTTTHATATIAFADINSGTVDSISSLTASGDLDIGAHGFRAQTLTADGLTSGRVIFAGTDGLLSGDSDMTFSGAKLTVTELEVSTSTVSTSTITYLDVSGGVATFAEVTTTDFYCSDCLNETEIEDIYLLFAGDEMTGNLTFDAGTVAIAGIQNQNLLDLTATESISGEWTFSATTTLATTTITRLGVGITTPSYALDVGGDINLSGTLYQGGSPFVTGYWTKAVNDIYYTDGNVSIGTTTANARLTIQSTSTDDILNLFETGGTKVLTILEDGKVGIGTSTPSQMLTVGDDNQFTVSSVGAITGLSYGGITEANLLDLTDTESISGEYTFSATTTLATTTATKLTATTFHGDGSNLSGIVITESDPIWIASSSDYYLKTEIDTQGEVEAIWSVSLANDSELHDAVTLDTSSHNYLSLSTQQIVLGQIEIGTSTDLIAGAGLSLSGFTLNLDNDFGADINVTELASEDFGDFTCDGTDCLLDVSYF
jgi:hypothetical protein